MTTRTARLSLFSILVAAAACGGGGDKKAPGWKPGDPITIDVSGAFAAGTVLRDAYAGTTATVGAGGEVTITPGAEGVVLLEPDGAVPSTFRWDAATVYFALTDRFQDGNPLNNESYGRKPDGGLEVGTFHGGDLEGLKDKLDYLASLGVNALWISPPVEQVHGWVGGGSSGNFKHYAYAGYWALDFTRLDANFGTEQELRDLVDAAHQRGIRVVLDVVLNHPGYATGDDLLAYLPEVFLDGTGDAFEAFTPSSPRNYFGWNDLVAYTSGAQSDNWIYWWGPDWIRAGLTNYTGAGTDDLTKSVGFLPDFKTEQATKVSRPPMFARKADTGVTDLADATVRDYLVRWHTRWVRDFGIDGFRCDTAKHVDKETWAALKDASVAALAAWKAENPTKKPDDLPFWTVAEVFPHGVAKDDYFATGKFDSIINFDFWTTVRPILGGSTIAASADAMETMYAYYAAALQEPGFDAMSYLSSHDTRLAFAELGESVEKQKAAGTALLLVPGSAQIFYGDESGRKLGPQLSDETAGTRSDMNWSSTDAGLLEHWRKLGAFRRKHAAVGAGEHLRLTSPAGTYAFQRKLGAGDAVVVVIADKG